MIDRTATLGLGNGTLTHCPSSVLGILEEVAVVAEVVAASDVMELLGFPMSLGIGPIGCVTRAHGQRSPGFIMQDGHDVFRQHGQDGGQWNARVFE